MGFRGSFGTGQELVPLKKPQQRVTFITSQKQMMKMAQFEPSVSK